METVKKVLAAGLLLLICSPVYSQIVRPGLFRAQLTLSTSKMLSEGQSSFYLHGNIEGYVTEKLSLAGEGYYYLGSLSENEMFDFNHSGFFGTSWHFGKNGHDLYIGLQPGLSITRINRSENNGNDTRTGVNPLFSTVLGYNFFVNRIFHFFIQTRLVAGEHNRDVHAALSELRLSAGLGFNLNAVKSVK